MKNEAMNRILSLLLTAAMVFTLIPGVTVYAANDIAAQTVALGTSMGALTLPDMLDATVDGTPGEAPVDEWQSAPDYDSGNASVYVFSAVNPDTYTIADDTQPPVITVTEAAEDNGAPPEIKTITAFAALPDETLWQGCDMGAISSSAALALPHTLTGTDEDNTPVTLNGVTWEAQPAFDPAVSGNYTFSPTLPEGYVTANGVTAPVISVFIRPAGGVGIMPLSSADITAEFTDPKFLAAVRSNLGKNVTDPIYDTDVAGLTMLYVPQSNITSLAGIEHFTALTTLNCSANQLTSLPALPGSLEELDCSANQLTSLPALPGSLEELNCSANQLASLPALPGSLTRLNCSANQLTGLVLNGTANYTNIDASYNNMADETAVTGKTIIWNGSDFAFLPQRDGNGMNKVFRAGIRNHVKSAAQLAGMPDTPYEWTPASSDIHATERGDTTIDVLSDNGVVDFAEDFRNLYKRENPSSSGNDVARYDVWVDLPVAHGTVSGVNVHFFIGGITYVLLQAEETDIIYLSSNTNNPFINALKHYVLDFSAITVNGSVIKPELIERSAVRLENVDGEWAMYYRLVIAELDITNTAAISADYEIQSLLKRENSQQTASIRVSFTHSKPTNNPLYLKPVHKGEADVYNIYTVNGIVCIDYANDIAGAAYAYDVWNGAELVSCTAHAAIPVGFQLYKDAAATVRIPAVGEEAYVAPGNNYTPVFANNSKFFVDLSSINYGGAPYEIMYIDSDQTFDNKAGAPDAVDGTNKIENDKELVLGVWLPNNYGQRLGSHVSDTYGRTTVVTDTVTKTMRIVIEGTDSYYRTDDIQVRFRPLSRDQIISQGSYTVSYDSGDATAGAAPFDEVNPYNLGDMVTVLGKGSLSHFNRTFLGWRNNRDGKVYREGEQFEIDGDVTLAAVFGNSSSGGGSNNHTVPAYPVAFGKNPEQPARSITDISAAPDKDNALAYTITEKMMKDALTEAKKVGVSPNGYDLVFNFTTTQTIDSLNIAFAADALTLLEKEGVKNTAVTTNAFRFSFDLAAIKELNKQRGGKAITVSAARTEKLSTEAKQLIGSRPAWDVNISFQKSGTAESIINLGKGYITLEMRYSPKSTEKTGNLTVVYVPGSGKPQILTQSSYDNGWMIWKRGTLSIYGVGYVADAPAFIDTKDHWAKDNIDFVASRGLLTGTGAEIFSPNGAITRGMFITALGRLSEQDMSGYAQSSFIDVAANSYYPPYIEWAVDNKIVQGVGGGRFEPDRSMSREEMAVMTLGYAKAAKCTLPTTREAVTFTDSAEFSAWAADSIKALQQAGVVSGMGNNLFNPKGAATRAEAATILRNFVELVIDPNAARAG